MTAAFVQSWGTGFNGAGSLSVSGATAGNLLVANFAQRRYGTGISLDSTTLSNWTEAFSATNIGHVYYRTASGTTADNLAWDAGYACVSVCEYSGVDPTSVETPIQVDSGTAYFTLSDDPAGANGLAVWLAGVTRMTTGGQEVLQTSSAFSSGSTFTFRQYDSDGSYAKTWNYDHIHATSATISGTWPSILPNFDQHSVLLLFAEAGAAAAALTASTGSFTLTGNAAGLEAGRKLTAEAQSYTLTGQDATLKQGFSLLAEQGTITYTGNAAGLTAGRKLAADQQTYTLTGIDAGLTYTPAGSYDLTADTGAFTLTGIAADLLAGRTIAADSAAYTVTGIAANLTYTPAGAYSLTADAGAYTLTGITADLQYARIMPAGAGAYTLTGIAADFARGYGMQVDAGAYTLTGIAVDYSRTYQVAAGVGAYTLTGRNVVLDYSAAEVLDPGLVAHVIRSDRNARIVRADRHVYVIWR